MRKEEIKVSILALITFIYTLILLLIYFFYFYILSNFSDIPMDDFLNIFLNNGIFLWSLPVIFAFLSLRQISRKKQKGKFFAVSALIICIFAFGYSIIFNPYFLTYPLGQTQCLLEGYKELGVDKEIEGIKVSTISPERLKGAGFQGSAEFKKAEFRCDHKQWCQEDDGEFYSYMDKGVNACIRTDGSSLSYEILQDGESYFLVQIYSGDIPSISGETNGILAVKMYSYKLFGEGIETNEFGDKSREIVTPYGNHVIVEFIKNDKYTSIQDLPIGKSSGMSRVFLSEDTINIRKTNAKIIAKLIEEEI